MRRAAEGADALQTLLDLPAARGATLPRARALAAAARLLEKTGAYATAEGYCQEALVIAQDSGDGCLVAELMHERAWIKVSQGQPGSAVALSEQGLGLARHLGETHLTARLLFARSTAAYVAGDHARAARDAAESLRLFRQAGDRLRAGALLGSLGAIELSANHSTLPGAWG
ncbi:MAG TPA: hypothetical protein VKG80_07455 [Trebonia sp.]|nr:hypothetical protein [Trebonia sp.]